jgi:ankyrin repeat protein
VVLLRSARLERTGCSTRKLTRPFLRESPRSSCHSHALLACAAMNVAPANPHHLAIRDLLEAVVKGDVSEVSRAIKENPKLLNANDPDGNTALIVASYMFHPEVVICLLDHGAEVRERAVTPLVMDQESSDAVILSDHSSLPAFLPHEARCRRPHIDVPICGRKSPTTD